MTRSAAVAAAISIPLALLATSGHAGAATPPTTPPSHADSAVPDDAVPDDFVMLVDDTATITVGAPSSWTDVDTAPARDRPFIEASADRQQYNDTFDVAGVTFAAAPFSADTEATARSFGLTGGCVDERLEPYDDGVFSGVQLVYTECGGAGSSAEFWVVAANPEDQRFTALLRVQITGPAELPILDGILNTFNTVSDSATTPGVGSTPASTPFGGPFPSPSGQVPADWVELVDDTATISMAVPPAWTDTDTTPGERTDGSPMPWITASTDLAAFASEVDAELYSVAGASFRALTFQPDTEAALIESWTLDFLRGCMIGEAQQEYDDGFFVGHIQNFTDCGGTPTRVVHVVANPPDGSFTAFVQIQLTGAADDAATLDGLLSSFNVAGAAPAPAATTTSTTVG